MNIHYYKTVRRFLFIVLLSSFVFISCCGKVKKDETSVRSESRNLYIKGKNALKTDSLEQAEANFNRALRINPFFAPAYEGLGLIALQNGEYGKAEKLFNNALSIDVNWIPAELGLLRIKVKRGKYEEAIAESNRLLNKLHSNGYSPEVKKQLEHDVIYWKKSARSGLQSLIIDDLGSGESLTLIADEDSVTRAQFTAAFIDVFWGRINDMQIINAIKADDLPDSLKEYKQIEMAINRGIVPPYPDNLFRPHHILKRAEAALIINKFLKLCGIRNFNKENECLITDINLYSPIYKPISDIINAGIMPCNENGMFFPDAALAGYEVMEILLRLKNYLEALP